MYSLTCCKAFPKCDIFAICQPNRMIILTFDRESMKLLRTRHSALGATHLRSSATVTLILCRTNFIVDNVLFFFYFLCKY